ncbi:protein NLRC5-like isoform X2 [Dysidea avara]|uniref:protein NLRC5-like isoform X2 n=1 Tax=Dysidea avara TaxID=196820 RepID=UPI00331A6CB1
MDLTDSKGLEQFKTDENATSIPLLKDLYEHITPQYAADWKVIGTLLGLPSGELQSIEAGYPTNVKWCCNQMLEKWLEMDTSASWEKLFKVIESPAVSAPDRVTSKPDKEKPGVTCEGLDAVLLLSDRVSRQNEQARFTRDENAWPPYQCKQFTPLLLIHHEDQHILKHSSPQQLAKFVQIGETDELTSLDKHHKLEIHEVLSSDTSRTTKELLDILATLEDNDNTGFVLIEGLPGIGKSLLLQEIAYQWSKKQLLQTFRLLLLVQLRNPAVQQVSFISDLLQLFCKGDMKGKEIASACSEYFFKNDGKDLIFLFDGFDEFPEVLQKDGLIADILKRQVLPNCGLVVSSRPHATVELRQKASVKVDILGFDEKERKQYIEQALKGQPHKITELTNYLDEHLTINGLCFVPFNMVALIFLYEQGITLPKSSVDLYQYFICLTICRHLAKTGHHLDNTITDLAKLPEPCKTIIEQLSRLSLKALNDKQLVFTFDEMKAACPGITESIDGFGLLQTVQHFGLAGKTMTFNFIHFSIQEFLAAYHIAHLPPHEEFRVLQEKFWSSHHSNMFSMYTSLTKGQRPSFKQFLQQPSFSLTFKQLFSRRRKDSIGISAKFLEDDLKCFHLFRCFHEAGDVETCQSILNSKVFNSDYTIDLNFHHLTVYDVECLTLFLVCSPSKVRNIYLFGCHIQDYGLHVLHRGLIASNCTIKQLWLGDNNLTQSSSSSIRDLTIHCGVELLWIDGNHTIGEDHTLFNILSHPSSKLTLLSIMYTKLSSNAAIILFTELAKGNKLQELYINIDDPTNETYDVITTTMKENTSLVLLVMNTDDVSAEDAQRTVKTLHLNNSVQLLYLPKSFPDDVKEKITLLQDEVNKKRESRGCLVKFCVVFF